MTIATADSAASNRINISFYAISAVKSLRILRRENRTDAVFSPRPIQAEESKRSIHSARETRVIAIARGGRRFVSRVRYGIQIH